MSLFEIFFLVGVGFVCGWLSKWSPSVPPVEQHGYMGPPRLYKGEEEC